MRHVSERQSSSFFDVCKMIHFIRVSCIHGTAIIQISCLKVNCVHSCSFYNGFQLYLDSMSNI